jgi:hypothetical protein
MRRSSRSARRLRTGICGAAAAMCLAACVVPLPLSAAWMLPDTKAVADAAAGLSTPGRFRLAWYALAAPNGRVWLVAKDFEPGYEGGSFDHPVKRRWLTYRLVDGQGAQVGRDITISIPGEPHVWDAAPLALLHDGSIVVGCDASQGRGRPRLARIDSTGVINVSGSVPGFALSLNALIDGRGLVHIAGVRRGFDYTQISTTLPGMPTVKELKYSGRYGTVDSAPFCMRWKGNSHGRTYAMAGCDEDSGRLVTATVSSEDSFIRLCRFDTKTLEALDSGLVYRERDVHHLVRDSTVMRLTLVRSDSGGFWLFLPGGMSPDHPMTARVYRLGHDLSTLRPVVVGHDSVRPFSQTPQGSLLTYDLYPRPADARYAGKGWSRRCGLGLDFTACGTDGRIYETHEERSVLLSGSK